MSSDQVTFYDAHTPALGDGDYSISVDHHVEGTGIPADTKFSLADELKFTVMGPRFALSSSQIHSVYPPNGAKGDFNADLPSLVLNRSTLPWERSPLKDNADSSSWLFLLLVTESEIKDQDVVEHNNIELQTLASFFESPKTGKPPLSSHDLDKLPKKINYLEVTANVAKLIPKDLSDLAYFSYARVKGDEEQAVLLCNRLPEGGKNSTVYLVSLENNYQGSTFQGKNIDTTNYILPYLYKWSFKAYEGRDYCITDQVLAKIKKTFPGTFTGLNALKDNLYTTHHKFVGALGSVTYAGSSEATPIALTTAQQEGIEKLAKLPGTNFQEILSHLTGGFAPFNAVTGSSTKLNSIGSIEMSLNRVTESGGAWTIDPTMAWYRGPLISSSDIKASAIIPALDPSTISSPFALPRTYRDFLIADNNNKPVDMSYAAAFELGRLVALDDVNFARQFYKWKMQVGKSQRSSGNHDILLGTPATKDPEALPTNLLDKFRSWQILENIPPRYLIPDSTLLPEESIRYFYIDPNWLNAFTYGAFSIGHSISADFSSYLKEILLPTTTSRMGFLLNSMAVSGWPDFQVDVTFAGLSAGTTNPQTFEHQTSQDLDVNVALFLFDHPFTELQFYLHPAKIHSGFHYSPPTTTNPPGPGTYKKVLPAQLGSGTCTFQVPATDPATKGPVNSNRTINPSVLAQQLGLKTGKNPIADFAAAMLKTVIKVEFKIS